MQLRRRVERRLGPPSLLVLLPSLLLCLGSLQPCDARRTLEMPKSIARLLHSDQPQLEQQQQQQQLHQEETREHEQRPEQVAALSPAASEAAVSERRTSPILAVVEAPGEAAASQNLQTAEAAVGVCLLVVLIGLVATLRSEHGCGAPKWWTHRGPAFVGHIASFSTERTATWRQSRAEILEEVRSASNPHRCEHSAAALLRS